MTQPTRLRPLSTDNYPRELVEDGGKLYFIDEDGNSSAVGVDVDGALDKTSENPIQNKVVATEIEGMKNTSDTHVANKNNPHAVTAAQVGLGNVNNTSDANKPVSTAQATAIGEAKTIAESAQTTANTHAAKTNNPHSVTAAQVGLGNVNNTSDANKPVSTAQATAIADAKKAGTDAQDAIDDHEADETNPHNVTASQVGLGNVNNTSDANKPVSTAQATAIADAKKAGTDAQTAIDTHEADTGNPHGVTAAQVGLGNVTNQSKATMFTSPAFTGTPTAPTAGSSVNNTQVATTAFVQAVVAEKLASSDAMFFKGTIGSSGATVTALPATHTAGWTYKVATAGTYAGVACEIGDLIICVTDGTTANNAHWTVVQNNIDGAVTGPAGSVDSHIALFNGATGRIIKDSGFTIGTSVPANAKFTDTVYTHPTGAGNNHIPAGGAAGKFLKWSSDGVAVWDVIPEYDSAGDDLGLVTTGGDVTIENGVITVNDNSHAHTIANVTGLQAALDGKAASSHGTHVSYDTTAPKANGTASAGSSAAVARADHIHPLQTNISGNAGSATKATNDSEDQAITGYIRGLSVSGKVITYTRGDGTTGTITTQDTDTTYTLSSFGITASAAELNYCDGVTSNIQTQLNGKAASSHGTHVTFATTAPKANGTAAAGSASTVARSDHVHPLQTTISGNAGSATKATNDSADQAITGYIRGLSVSGKVITYTRGDGTTGTITTQDTNTTYTFNGAVSTIKDSNLTASRALISNGSGKVAVSAVTSTELGYLDGVTSAIQTQLDAKSDTDHTHISLFGKTDNRSVATTPNDYNSLFTIAGLKNNSKIGNPSDDTYSGVIGFRQWSDNSGGNSHELAFNDSGLYMRAGADTSWGAWEKFITSSSIGSQSVNYATSAGSATKATQDSKSQNIASTYIKGLSVSGKVITYTRGDGTTGTITTQDTNTTYTLSSFGITATAAELNYCDGVTSNIQTQLNGKAASSHGNHVPATQTANNAKFLRNDNTWQTVTPANIGAATSSHTHSTYMPIAGGTFTGKAYAQANTSYTTYQLRNIALSTSAATPTGNGSILGVYS